MASNVKFELNEELIKEVRARVIQLSKTESLDIRTLNTSFIAKASSGDPEAKEYVLEKCRTVMKKMFPNQADTSEFEELIREVYAYNWGLGPLDKYDTDDVDELMINGTRISIEKRGQITTVDERFANEDEALAVIRRAIEFEGCADLNTQNPIVYAERADGARITASIPPVCKEVSLNIRKFSSFVPTTENLIKVGTITAYQANLIKLACEAKSNMVVLGEMGSGKTTFMTWIIGFMSPVERIGILETVFEVNPERFYKDHYFVQLKEWGDLTLDACFRYLLRANVKRILVGEMRSGQDLQNFKMGCTRGQPGCVGTFHSSSPMQFLSDGADLLTALEPTSSKHQQELGLATAVDLVLQFRKFSDGRRVCVDITELVRDGDKVWPNVITKYELDDNNPSAPGEHVTVNRFTNKFLDQVQTRGELGKDYIKGLLGYGPGEGNG